ncbi:MAG: acyclic terpene utilization AtuA family protein [Betaproteobacteria bacterium]|nr:acyclic terpene utilization AtuA family protein [Betaproteobacteria bacterium]
MKPELRVLAASGQLGYGIPEAAFSAGIARAPHVIGADMGSIDPGPAYLGSGRMATSPEMTRRDLGLVLSAARGLGVPLLIGSAGTAGARPHLDATLEIVRGIAHEKGLRFRLASIAADIPKALARDARPLGAMRAMDLEGTTHLVGQMGTEAFIRALDAGADVVVAGRACDTAIFAAIPLMRGYAPGLAMHMAKIIECTSLCCEPGGRDAILATLSEDSFELESMNPARAATPLSVAAHALYEQEDPYTVQEPEGTLDLRGAQYEAIDARRTRVRGALWQPRARPTVKIEGAGPFGERSVLLCSSADPRVIENLSSILLDVEATTRQLVPGGDFSLYPRVYGEAETFLLVECIAPTAARGLAVLGVFRQYLLHHGFAGRLSTGGNVAFPFTPPELPAGTAYRFTVYHVMDVEALAPLFPVSIEDIA